MPNFGMLPLQGTLGTFSISTATTQSATSAALSIPLAESYRFVLALNTVSGTTSPVLDVFLDTSPDGGTNYFPFLHFAQCTTSGQGQQIVMRPYLGFGDSATTAAAPLLGVVDGATGATAIAYNGPIDPAHIKVRAVVGGSGSPSFNFQVNYIALPPANAVG